MSIGTGYCKQCGKQVMVKKKGANHWLHLILTLLTGGFWLIIWLLCAISWDDWFCNNCGSKVAVNSKAPKSKKKKDDGYNEEEKLKCPECNKETLASNKQCHNCGYPLIKK